MIILLKFILFFLIFLFSLLIFHIFMPLKISFRGLYRQNKEKMELSLYWIPYLLEIRYTYVDKKNKISILLFNKNIPINREKDKDPKIKDKRDQSIKRDKNTLEKEEIRVKEKFGRFYQQIKKIISFYTLHIVDIHYLQSKFIRTFKHIYLNAFHFNIKKYEINYGSENAYETHQLHSKVLLLQHTGYFINSRDKRIHFIYHEKHLSGKINLFFYINIYSILFRLMGLIIEYKKIKKLIEKYADYRDTG